MKKLHIDQLNRLSISEFRKSQKFPLVVVLDDIRSRYNIGSLFRTADAFRLEKIYLCGITAVPPSREITKTALGATESVEWEYMDNTPEVVSNLKEAGYAVYAIEQCEHSNMLQDYLPEAKLAVVFGNEVKGVKQEVIDVCDGCIEVPQFGTKHSLNISVSAGIIIWDIFSKQKALWEHWK
ncbi:MAG: RNA methyltransferase [Bacteroidales bacterium]